MQYDQGIDPEVFITATRDEISNYMKKVDPLWTVKLQNYHDLMFAVAFKRGFWGGLLVSAGISILLLFITR